MTDSIFARVLLVVVVAVAAHLLTILFRNVSARLIRSRMGSETKALTITGFVTSVIVFAVYFAAVGYALSVAGVPMGTYLASASVIGLAVSFGSQGIVQDVIQGLTVVFTDLVDVGDMVEIGGQVGIVEKVGMRFTVLTNFFGARVFIPNRSIANVTSYPSGYVRAFMDARLPAGVEQAGLAKEKVWAVAESVYEQYPGILLVAPTIEGVFSTGEGAYFRVKFRIWPGQGGILEGAAKQDVVRVLKTLDDTYGDWMVTVHYRAEPAGEDSSRRLPRPSALFE